MAGHKSHFNHQFVTSGADRVPVGAGDRFWGQDLAKDFRYLQGLSGRLMAELIGATSALLKTGAVTAASATTLNVPAAKGYAQIDVEADDESGWVVPVPTETRTIPVLVEGAAGVVDVSGATLDGSTPNYLKLRYAEADGSDRTRHFSAGDYPYFLTDSAAWVADANAPTAYDILVATFVGNGSTNPTITVAVAKGWTTGHGSLMNADKLDGVESARVHYGDNLRGTVEVTDADAVVKSGAYSLATPFTNAPSAAAYRIFHVQDSGSDDGATQVAVGATNNSYVRTKAAGTWSGWVKVWNSSNDGASSGLDADLVRGLILASGSYTPTVTKSGTAITSIVVKDFKYMRVGDNVKVSGIIEATEMAGSGNNTYIFDIELPIAAAWGSSANEHSKAPGLCGMEISGAYIVHGTVYGLYNGGTEIARALLRTDVSGTTAGMSEIMVDFTYSLT